MKLNAASEMLPVTWPEFANMHPFAPADQAKGYDLLINSLNSWLVNITGFAAVSTQPNSGVFFVCWCRLFDHHTLHTLECLRAHVSPLFV
jgi:hypothetical protein